MVELAIPSTHRPTVYGRRYMVATGHHLATAAAVRVLEAGGNATDAGVAAGLCLNVVQPEFTNLGGIAPIILYDARTGTVHTISGVGCWPAAITPTYFSDHHAGSMPAGPLRWVVPAAADSWLAALQTFGTQTLGEVAASAIDLAANGFALYPQLHGNLLAFAPKMAAFPASLALFQPDGEVPKSGTSIVQSALAETLMRLVEAEAGQAHAGRISAIQAARDRFYRGDIADAIAEFVKEQGGLLERDDLAAFSVTIDAPYQVEYRGNQVFGCPGWSQGSVALQALGILAGFDLASMPQGSADELYLIVEALNLAFADREGFIADPLFTNIPIDGLLNPEYLTMRRALIEDRAFAGLRSAGEPWVWSALAKPLRDPADPVEISGISGGQLDTSYICVIDAQGNAFSSTPSDGVGTSPIIPELGFVISDRGSQSHLDPAHPNSIAPGKRPRTTPSPGLILRNGQVLAAYGSPGGDVQPQAMVQFVVNLIDHGMDPQAAIEAPRIASAGFAETFFPYTARPGVVLAEGRIRADVITGLQQRGHTIERWPEWSPASGALCAIVVDPITGNRLGAADPRRTGYAFGW